MQAHPLPAVVNLTLMDLPGLTKNAVGEQELFVSSQSCA